MRNKKLNSFRGCLLLTVSLLLGACKEKSPEISETQLPVTEGIEAQKIQEKQSEQDEMAKPASQANPTENSPPAPVHQSPQTREAARRSAMDQMQKERNSVSK